jgi:hypothetical protein
MRYEIALRLLGSAVIVLCLVPTTHGYEATKYWYFGEGLGVDDEFTFDVCDPMLRIPETDSHYTVTMRFLALLPAREGMTWVVAAHVDHRVKTADMIFQVLADSFKIRTDATSDMYADSIDRTIGWVKQFSNENKPQVLSVGKVWGVIGGDASPAQLIVGRADSDAPEKSDTTYTVSYLFLRESQLQIKDGFPFPLKASVYKPVWSHQNAPLAFTFQLTGHNNVSDVCRHVFPATPLSSTTLPHQKAELPADNLLEKPNHYQNHTNTDVEEFTIDEILRQSNHNSTVQKLLRDAYGHDYREKLRESMHNFTKFIEMIANASNTILQSQIE